MIYKRLVQIPGRTGHPHYDPDFIYVDADGRVYVMDRGALRQVIAHYDRHDEHTRYKIDMIAWARREENWLRVWQKILWWPGTSPSTTTSDTSPSDTL